MASSRKTDAEVAASTAPTSGLVTAEELDNGGEIVVAGSTFDHEALASIDSFSDAIRLATGMFGGVINAHEDVNLGTGFRLTSDEDKFRLCGVPLLLLDWRFNPGDYGDDYVSVHAIQQDENGKAIKLVINDGGTGICRDLRKYTEKTGRMGGVFCRRGLRVSEYDTVLDGPDAGKPAPRDYVGKTGKGKTFYLDFSA